jgi:phage/plasmid-associated DNA primase
MSSMTWWHRPAARTTSASARSGWASNTLKFLLGQGENGKGCFVELVKLVLADYAISAPATLLLAGGRSEHPTEIMKLRGARLATCSEINEGSRFDEAKMKEPAATR